MKQPHLRFILGDQLTRTISCLKGVDKDQDIILMVEVAEEATYVRHHKQKIAFLFSAMRHFAESLRAEGIRVDYVTYDDPQNTGSFGAELQRAIAKHQPEAVVVTEPGEWRVWQMMLDWREGLSIPLHIRNDDRFICSRDEFSAWAGDKKSLRMEFFYREMRRKTGFLMDGNQPTGGQWNFDQENRKSFQKTVQIPARELPRHDVITEAVLELVDKHFAEHFGDLRPFQWAVTRDDALAVLHDFISHKLPLFGDYQDAMKTSEDFLYHSVISPYLNAGLLTPIEICEAAIQAYQAGSAPLNAVEGFVRQIIGWREFVRGIYWTRMPDYAESNYLSANRPIPAFFWTGETDMHCMAEAIRNSKQNAYAHHIQRLMITGNFALLAGIDPRAIEEWYLVVYADAYEWVELPNVHGMVLHADGGLLGSKPYAASGAYINRMSNYCSSCRYAVEAKSGPKACPFNALYWNFLITNEAKLAHNPRMAMPYKTLSKMTDDRRGEIKRDAATFLDGMKAWAD